MILPTTPMLPAFLGRQMQIAFVVKDLDEALRFWTEAMNVGPFVVIEGAMDDRHFVHRGQVSPVKATLAFCYVGETQIEIICQSNDAPSPYTEFLASGRQGMQHIAFWPEDFDAAGAALEAMGFETVCAIGTPTSTQNVTYYSGPEHLGVMVEIAPTTPDRLRYFAGMKHLADNWDGTRPIRRFRTRAEYMASDDCNA